MSFMLQVHVI